jgi:hypothetical protein
LKLLMFLTSRPLSAEYRGEGDAYVSGPELLRFLKSELVRSHQ